jgi:hypothetical protein
LAVTPKRLFKGVLGTLSAMTTVYTVPVSATTIVKNIVIVNANTSVAIPVSVYLGGSALVYELNTASKETVVLDVTQVMSAGETLQYYVPTAGVTVHVSGVEVS